MTTNQAIPSKPASARKALIPPNVGRWLSQRGCAQSTIFALALQQSKAVNPEAE